MRNPDRIIHVLAALREIWEKRPDLRLTQLIGNVFNVSERFYNIEDDEFIKSVIEFYDTLEGPLIHRINRVEALLHDPDNPVPSWAKLPDEKETK